MKQPTPRVSTSPATVTVPCQSVTIFLPDIPSTPPNISPPSCFPTAKSSFPDIPPLCEHVESQPIGIEAVHHLTTRNDMENIKSYKIDHFFMAIAGNDEATEASRGTPKREAIPNIQQGSSTTLTETPFIQKKSACGFSDALPYVWSM